MEERSGATVPLFLLLLLLLLFRPTAVTTTSLALPGCRETCGNDVSIPYPFGIGEGCYLNFWYNITCEGNRPFLSIDAIEILNISLDAQALINGQHISICYNSQGVRFSNPVNNYISWGSLWFSPFRYSFTRNKLVAIGCDTIVYFSTFQENFESGCMSFCYNKTSLKDDSCLGAGCCQIPIPQGLPAYQMSLESRYNHSNSLDYNPCSYAFLADEEWFTFKASDLSLVPKNLSEFVTDGYIDGNKLPVVLDWAIGNETCEEAQIGDPASYACGGSLSSCVDSTNGPGYRCYCNKGYQGNPYLSQGCQDINECGDTNNIPCHVDAICTNTPGDFQCSCKPGYHGDGKIDQGTGCTRDTKSFPVIHLVLGIGLGSLFLIISSYLLYWALKQRRLIKLREKFFLQNGGLLLQQQISSRTGVSDIAKIFTVQDLKRATNNYDESRVLGQGGYGTVYKGILPDKRVVAIKKSKLMDQSQITQFINEVDILSQINHRNVVKLLGCCLETEVPVLVYEFVSNGTLLQHIQNESNTTTISWGYRLRIASETAGALAYLHSAHSIPVLHRDVKSANILLDDSYIAKVSDFGASRLVPLDQTQMTTLVQGTLGYLDPECFQTGQLTEKSDVYSFGVVLVELLTGEKPISLERFEEHRNLAMYFMSSIKENRLFHILDDRVLNEGDNEQLLAVAELARRCLKLKGEERPTMKEVAAELDKLRMFQEHPWVQQNHEETEVLLGEPSNFSTSDVTGPYSVENDFMQPLEIA